MWIERNTGGSGGGIYTCILRFDCDRGDRGVLYVVLSKPVLVYFRSVSYTHLTLPTKLEV